MQLTEDLSIFGKAPLPWLALLESAKVKLDYELHKWNGRPRRDTRETIELVSWQLGRLLQEFGERCAKEPPKQTH